MFDFDYPSLIYHSGFIIINFIAVLCKIILRFMSQVNKLPIIINGDWRFSKRALERKPVFAQEPAPTTASAIRGTRASARV